MRLRRSTLAHVDSFHRLDIVGRMSRRATGLTSRSKRRRWVRSAAFVLLSIQLSAPVNAQHSEKVRVAYSAFSISFLNIFIARDAGLFKKHGLDVELIQMAGPLPVAVVAAGEIH